MSIIVHYLVRISVEHLGSMKIDRYQGPLDTAAAYSTSLSEFRCGIPVDFLPAIPHRKLTDAEAFCSILCVPKTLSELMR
jgi:hypothetical protein